MSGEPGPGNLGIIGPGRAGAGLGLALARAGYRVRLHGRREKPLPAPLTLTIGPDGTLPPWLPDVDVLILAVPDDCIESVAAALARAGAIAASQVVLHLSGVRGHDALVSLAGSGAGLGSLHPLQTIVDPVAAPEHLRGAWAAVEGDPRGVEVAERLARDAGLHPFRIALEAKVRYHAAAVFASNYFVVVEAIAERLAASSGVPAGRAWEVLHPLVQGTMANLGRAGPLAALTGPVRRGDTETIRRHLAVLDAADARLYRELGAAALALAVGAGMDETAAERVRRVLAIDPRSGSPPEG